MDYLGQCYEESFLNILLDTQMLTTSELKLSNNKRDYSPDHGSYQLSSEEIFYISQYYAQKKNIRLYVQTYLPTIINQSKGDSDIVKIQNQLTENEYAGYLHTEGATGNNKSHVECIIITNNKIIKPIEWNVTHGVVRVDGYPNSANANLLKFTKNASFRPQSDVLTCASLSLSYLKQLLKNDAKQIKELTLSVPYFNESDSSLCHFFVPSPQSLRYSQSSSYNEYLAALVIEDEPGLFKHKYKWIEFTTLKYELEKVLHISKHKNLPDVTKEVQNLLNQLPTFREAWKEAFNQMQCMRSLMDHSGLNMSLAYTSRRLRKIALFEQERVCNPGLALVKEIKKMKESHSLSDEDLLSFFSDYFSKLVFKNATQLSYFLNDLCDLIDGTIVYPFIFKFKNHFKIITQTNMYMESKFFLSSIHRLNLNNYFKQPTQFILFLNQQGGAQKTIFNIDKMNTLISSNKGKSSLLNNEIIKYNVQETLSWLNLLGIPEQDKLAFLQERVPKDSLSSPLIDYVIYQYSVSFLYNYFKDKQILLTFLNFYIEKGKIVPLLTIAIKHYLSTLNILFESKKAFYAFIDEYIPIDKAITYLKDDEFFELHFCDYLTCIDPNKRSTLLLKEFNNFSSELFKKISSDKQHPRWILEYLEKYCNEIEIENYLITHRDYLLAALMKQLRIYPLNLKGKLHDITKRIHFFSSTIPHSLIVYQNTFLPCEQDRLRCLIDVLKCLPATQRRGFIEDVFASQKKEQILSISLLEPIKSLLPESCEQPQERKVPDLAKLANHYNDDPEVEKNILEHFQHQDINKVKFCQYAFIALKTKKLITEDNINRLRNINDINKFDAINRLYSVKILNQESFNVLFYSEHISSLKIADYLIAFKKNNRIIYRDLYEIKNIIKTLEVLKFNNLLDNEFERFIITHFIYCNDIIFSIQQLEEHNALEHFSILKNLFENDQAEIVRAVSKIIIEHPKLINKISELNQDSWKIYVALVQLNNIDFNQLSKVFIHTVISHVDYAMDLVSAYNMIKKEIFTTIPDEVFKCLKEFPQESLRLKNSLFNLKKLNLIEIHENENLFDTFNMIKSEFEQSTSNPILKVIFNHPVIAENIVSAIIELKKYNLLNTKNLFILLSEATLYSSLDIVWSIKKLDQICLLNYLNPEDVKAVSRIKRKEASSVFELVVSLLKQIVSLYNSKNSLSFYLMKPQKIDEKIEEYRIQIYKIANTECDVDLLEIAKNLKNNIKLTQVCNLFGFSLFNSETTSQLNAVQDEFLRDHCKIGR